MSFVTEPKIIERDTPMKGNYTEPRICTMVGRDPNNPSSRARSDRYEQFLEMGDDVSNTLTSVQKDNLVAEPNVLTPKRTDFGKQVRKQYESGELDMSRHDMTEFEPRTDGVSNTLTSVQKDNLVAEPLRIPQATKQGYIEVPPGSLFDMSYPESKTRRGRVQEGGKISPTLMASGEAPCFYKGTKNMTNEEAGLFKDSNKTYSGEILRLLQQKIGEETYKWAIGRFRYILKKEILQSGLHEEIFCKERENESRLFTSSSHVKKDSVSCTTETNGVRDLRFDSEHRCSSQGFQLSEQFAGEFNDIVQKLSHENPSTKTIMSNLWESCGQQGSLQQTLFEVEEIWESFNCKREVSYRIRKLTPREVFRLMGVSESDIDKIQQSGVSQSQQYRMAGNSIVVDVLEHIFRKMFVDTGQESQQLSLF